MKLKPADLDVLGQLKDVKLPKGLSLAACACSICYRVEKHTIIKENPNDRFGGFWIFCGKCWEELKAALPRNRAKMLSPARLKVQHYLEAQLSDINFPRNTS